MRCDGTIEELYTPGLPSDVTTLDVATNAYAASSRRRYGWFVA